METYFPILSPASNEKILFLFSLHSLTQFFPFRFYKFILFFIYLFLAVLGLLAAHFISLVAASGATLRCGAQASHCGGFSCCGAQALGAWASVTVARGLSSCGSRALERRLSSCGARA